MSLFRRRPTAQPSQRRDLTAPALQPTPVHRVSLAEQEEMGLAPRPKPSMYVPAASEIIQMPKVDLTSPDAHIGADITPAAVIEAKTLGSHADRARAWIKYSVPLCIAIAVSMSIAAVALYDVPVFSFATLLTFGLSFVLSYTVLLLQYWQHTPEGVALVHTRQLWRYLRDEQAHRHTIESEAWTDQRAITARREERR